ncbi:MAG: RNA polymerase sigma factor SigJ [Polyangia bacterium]
MTARDRSAPAGAGNPGRGIDWERELGAQRRRLFAIAYRMLGSASEAEDMLQEAYLRVAGETDVAQPAALLRTVVVRLCIDQLKSARHARTSYVGPWLPEPLLTADVQADGPARSDERIDELESLSFAFLLMLETLSPLERAVLVLHDVFDHDYEEIASMLGRSQAACRQLLSRARANVKAERPRYRATEQQGAELLSAFLGAVATGDVAGLSRLLTSDVVMTSDGGGEARAARRPVYGPDKVARFFVGVARKGGHKARAEPCVLNGAPGVLLWDGDTLQSALVLETDERGIRALRIVVRPSKLAHLLRTLRERSPGP